MEQYKEGQYDDDLTVGIDEYDNDFDTGDIDLFDYAGNEGSPLSRLKSIILSIDWEISDSILLQFNEELLDLQDIWAGNKINLIYVQALEKLSRYIYKEKASAHPNAIKLLMNFYSNLEKIVSDEDITEQQKKNLLRADIEKFEKLKKQISPSAPSGALQKEAPAQMMKKSPSVIAEDEPNIPVDDGEIGKPAESDPLLNLKAIVYGIDWEITEQDLNNLSREVKVLEQEFKTSKAKQIFLQGIGSLGAYINLKRSDAHADAFKLLHSFFAGLESVVRGNLSGQEEKNILLSEVERFNAFKTAIADTISPDAIAKSSDEEDESIYNYEDDIQPAFADVPEGIHGFREDEEETEPEQKGEEIENDIDQYFDDDDDSGDQEQDLDNELAQEMESRLEGMFDDLPSHEEAVIGLDAEAALRGVDVETDADDETDEEPLPEEDGELSPALAADDEYQVEEDSPAVFTDTVDDFFDESGADDPELQGKELPGVDVEHEADDDYDEDPLPYKNGEYAPALSADNDDDEDQESREEQDYNGDIENRLDNFFGESDQSSEEGREDVEEIAEVTESSSAADDIEDRLTDFFGESEPEISSENAEEALKGIEVETAEDDESEEEPLPYENGEIAPALREDEEEQWEEESAADESAFDLSTDAANEQPEQDLSAAGQEEEAVEERFDQLFGAEEERTDFDTPEHEGEVEADFADITAEEETEGQAIQGVDVETEEDDESDEESLPFEDGELAPALAGDEGIAAAVDKDEQENEEAAESEVSDRFDSFFDDSVPEEEEDSEQRTEEEPDDDEQDFAPLEEDYLEVSEDEFEEISEETAVKNQEAQSDDEILAFLNDEDDSLLAFDDFPEEEIKEMTAEEIGAVLVEDGVVRTSGETPSGYSTTDELLGISGEAQHAEETEEYISHPEGNEDYILAVEGLNTEEDEEVIFELVDETEELADPLVWGDEAESDYDDSQYFGTTLLADEPVIRKTAIPAELGVHASNSFDLSAPPEVEENNSGYLGPQGTAPTQDMLDDLRNCIISLGLEIDDDILNGLNEEIEKLRHLYLNKPVEKTFIQLLATVSGHIGRYRYEADSEANRLLLSIFDKLELSALGQADSSEIQEAVLNETSKVLHWQARLIDRTPAVREDEDVFEDTIETAADDETIGEEISTGLDEMYRKVDEIGNDMLMQKVSSIMKAELDQLKSAFHAELTGLKEEIRRRNT